MSVTFTLGEVSVTLRNPERSNVLRKRMHQATGRTAGGVFYSYDKGVTIQVLGLAFTELTSADKAALDSCFENTVTGTEITFTYTDHASQSWTARFIQDELEWAERFDGFWDLSLEMEVEEAA